MPSRIIRDKDASPHNRWSSMNLKLNLAIKFSIADMIIIECMIAIANIRFLQSRKMKCLLKYCRWQYICRLYVHWYRKINKYRVYMRTGNIRSFDYRCLHVCMCAKLHSNSFIPNGFHLWQTRLWALLVAIQETKRGE